MPTSMWIGAQMGPRLIRGYLIETMSVSQSPLRATIGFEL